MGEKKNACKIGISFKYYNIFKSIFLDHIKQHYLQFPFAVYGYPELYNSFCVILPIFYFFYVLLAAREPALAETGADE